MNKKQESGHLLPTAPVGCIVHYMESVKEPDVVQAAIVCKVEEPGRVTLLILKPMCTPIWKQGIFHISHPDMEKRGPLSSRGAWKLVDWLTPRGTLDLAKEREAKRQAQIEASLRSQEAIMRQEREREALSLESEPRGV